MQLMKFYYRKIAVDNEFLSCSSLPSSSKACSQLAVIILLATMMQEIVSHYNEDDAKQAPLKEF